MSLTIIAIALLMITLLGAGSICWGGESRIKQQGLTEMQTNEKATSCNVLREQLRELAKSTPPKRLSMGAMCYEMAVPPDRAEYICVTCSNKTLYVAPSDNHWTDETQFIAWELQACRRLISQVQGLDVQLDESSFCKQCSPDAKERQLALVIEYKDIGKTHTVSGISANDLTLLIEFTSGKQIHIAEQGREIPLKESIPRLEELLGVSLNDD